MLWIYESFFPAIWILFVVFWHINSANTKATRRSEPIGSRILRAFIFVLASSLFWMPRTTLPWLYTQLWPSGFWPFWLGAAITISGLPFAIRAREYLGHNWSRSVTIKQGHELITSGPYSKVRHPIYTGVLTGLLGTAVALSQVRGFIVLGLFFLAFWLKLRLEEQWMRNQFGLAYESYASHTAALVPHLL